MESLDEERVDKFFETLKIGQFVKLCRKNGSNEKASKIIKEHFIKRCCGIPLKKRITFVGPRLGTRISPWNAVLLILNRECVEIEETDDEHQEVEKFTKFCTTVLETVFESNLIDITEIIYSFLLMQNYSSFVGLVPNEKIIQMVEEDGSSVSASIGKIKSDVFELYDLFPCKVTSFIFNKIAEMSLDGFIKFLGQFQMPILKFTERSSVQ